MTLQKLLIKLYHSFNTRQIDGVLAHMHTDVSWPNGWEGGYLCGHQQMRNYWLRQWQQIDPAVEPIRFDLLDDGRLAVKVNQIIKDLQGKILSDTVIFHVYTFEDQKVRTMAIEH